VGVFLESFTRRSYGLKELAAYEGPDQDVLVRVLDERVSEQFRESLVLFEQACQQEGVRYSIHRDQNIALQELLEESIYAELLIISADQTMTDLEEPVPSHFVWDVLNDIQCPVIPFSIES
jgi:hypothetical protein